MGAPHQLPQTCACPVFVPQSSPTEDQSSVIQTEPMHLSPEGQQKRQDGEDMEHLSMLHVPCQQIPCANQKWAGIFSSLPFTADTAAETLLITLVLNIPCQIKFQVSFGFARAVCLFSSRITCPCFDFPYASL